MANMTETIKYIIQVQDKYSKQLNEIDKKLGKVDGQAKKAKKSSESLGNSLQTLAAAAGIGILLKSFFSLGIQLETTKTKFEVLTGSATKTAEIIDDIYKLAQKSPFSALQLQRSTELMLNMGISAEKVGENVDTLSEIAGGSAAKLQSLTIAFSQISSKGVLTGQDLRQMQEQGFNPLAEIARTTGESISFLTDEVSRGNISFQQVSDSLKSATSEGGRFYKMNEKIAQTAGGKIAKIQGETTQMLAQMSEDMMNSLKPVLDVIISLVGWMTKHAEAIGFVMSALIPLSAIILAYIAYTKIAAAVTALWNAIMLANPIGLVVGGLILLGSMVVYAYEHFDKFRFIVDGVWGVLKNVWDIISSFISDLNFDNFGDKFMEVFDKIGTKIKEFVKSRLSPFIEAFQHIKNGEWMLAAKSLGKGLFGLTPMGMGADLVNSIYNSDPFQQAGKEGAKQKEVGSEDAADVVNGKSPGGSSAGGDKSKPTTNKISAAAKVNGITINIGTFGNIENIYVQSAKDIEAYKDSFQAMLTSMMNDGVRDAR